MHQRHAAHQAGFTLIEMIIVMVIMALVAGLVLVKQPWRSAGLNADVTRRALINGMQLARSRAIAQDREVAVVTGPRGFSVDGGALWQVPSDQALSPSQVVFTPDGGSTGGRVLLTAGARRIAIEVNWLTSTVRSQEVGSP
jgi:general secretion pathway protein H